MKRRYRVNLKKFDNNIEPQYMGGTYSKDEIEKKMNHLELTMKLDSLSFCNIFFGFQFY